MSVVFCLPIAFLVFQFDDLLPLLTSTCPFYTRRDSPDEKKSKSHKHDKHDSGRKVLRCFARTYS